MFNFILKIFFWALVFYGLGFGLFLTAVPSPYKGDIPTTEGLAVLTGGSGRVATTLDHVRAGFAGPVLISGVHPHVSLEDLEQGTPLPTEATDRLTLDKDALNTRLNVDNTRMWAEAHGLLRANGKRVGIVTSTYHVPRVYLLSLWRAPSLSLVFYPVRPEAVSLRSMLLEYNKLLFFWWKGF
ncbi:MAG: hypothetical protein COY40_04720 [Alphaproteobacteria bacterium CG_4_10_14_0_8_um_filter_53_9]|nr:MAG: hypothetical protein COY40_04720 [Alphaproteobacteria bacterium CG_4_10_14_0_8_um_filter_53_9]